MVEEGFKRKLAAILSADVEGYSRLMSDDEASTVKTLSTYKEVFRTIILQTRGRLVDSTGDALLAEFASVVDAVQCAVAVQKELMSRNLELSKNRRMQFRIGVNLGDVIEEGGTIYGDGVNVAARLEKLAEPGGVCISNTAFDQIEAKLPYGYEFMGEQAVKNIAKPVGAYRVLMDPRVSVAGAPEDAKRTPARLKSVHIAIALVIFFSLAVGIWKFYLQSDHTKTPPESEKALQSPAKPSIAVLPFKNLSDDPEQEFFADGMTEDLITALSKLSGISVISRNSVFTFKDKPVKMQQVAKELNADYVLEGSIRRSEKTIRLNAQLINAKADRHLWAEKYDEPIEDIFRLQDSITQAIVSTLSVKLTGKEASTSSIAETSNIHAHDLLLKARVIVHQYTPEAWAEAIKLLKEAVELDPNYTRAYAELAYVYWFAGLYGPNYWKACELDRPTAFYLGMHYLDLAMQNPDSKAYQLAAYVSVSQRRFSKAAEEARRAVELSPNDPDALILLARSLKESNPQKAFSVLEKVAKYDPLQRRERVYVPPLVEARANFFMKNFDKTVDIMERAQAYWPDQIKGAMHLTAAYAHLGRINEAKQNFDIYERKWGKHPPPEEIIRYWGIEKPENADLLIEGLIKAGYPAQPDKYCRLSESERLSIEQVKKLLLGNTLTGFSVYSPNRQFWNTYNKNGICISKGLNYSIEREFGFEDDEFYTIRDVRGHKVKTICRIYLNPHGDYEQKSEYIYLTESYIGPVSVLKESH